MGSFLDSLLEILVSYCAGIIKDLAECESRIGVDASTDGGCQARKIAEGQRDDLVFKRFEGFLPLASLGVVPSV